jgi:iron complex transport system ATP-binding protein
MSIATREVRWAAGGRIIVDGITLDAPAGGMLGLLGPNGSGKSSLLRLLGGLRRASGGVVTLGGQDIAGLGRAAIARRVAVVEQQSVTDAPVTVLEVVRLGRTPHRGPLAAWSSADEAAVETALCHTELQALRQRDWHTLSGGERQRAQIARALAQSPSELLLDEPTNHLDIRHQLEVLTLVSRLPVTSVVALHDLNLAAMFCDTLAILSEGRVVASGRPEEVLTESIVGSVFGVRTHIGPSLHHGRLHVQFLPG